MSEPYPDVVARFYDAVYAEVRDGVDNAYYLKTMAEAGGPVLEIGVGTGRLLVEALARGVDAYGIDISPTMIERCRAKLPARRRGAGVGGRRRGPRDRPSVCPRRGPLSGALPRRRLRTTRCGSSMRSTRVLRPGGLFVFDLYVPALKLLLEGLPEMSTSTATTPPESGCAASCPRSPPTSCARRTTSGWASSGTRRTASTGTSGSSTCGSSSATRSSTSWRARLLALEAIHGDFAGGPLGAESREFVVVCRRDEEDG